MPPTTQPSQSDPVSSRSFFTQPVVLVSLLGALFIGIAIGVFAFAKDEVPLVKETTQSPATAGDRESAYLNKITITTPTEQVSGEEKVSADRIFAFTNRFFSIVFAYPNDPRYVVQHWESGELEKAMKSVQLHVIDTNSDKTFLSIYEQDAGYCYLSWCELKAKETLKTPYFTWEYLGSTTYMDAGEVATFENLYRTQNGDFTMYVVTKKPIDLANDSDVAVKIFKSLYPGI